MTRFAVVAQILVAGVLLTAFTWAALVLLLAMQP